MANLPPVKLIKDVLDGLLGRDVEIAPSDPMTTVDTVGGVLAVYVDDGNALRAVAGWDLPAAAHVGAAVGLAAASTEKSLRMDAVPTYLSVGIPTPFKIVDEYVMTSAPRGEVYRRKYRVERDPGFAGPIEVRLADRQARRLQGVTGPVLVVPTDKSEFEYPAYLPPWMELGRTCRVCVMAVGKVRDADGTEHSVAFSSVGQNQQMIVVAVPTKVISSAPTDWVLGSGIVGSSVMIRTISLTGVLLALSRVCFRPSAGFLTVRLRAVCPGGPTANRSSRGATAGL